MTPIIQITNLSKSYSISHEGRERYTSLRDVIANNTRKIFSFPKSLAPTTATKEKFWALKDVSFDIEQGERVGIIGRNGAGKSTLLKILSRITEPTTGAIKIKGRVASLLEVGTGFHPELTGRENIYLNGAILGMSRAEIKKHFDAIVDFAETEKFLDTPVKRYSSGMYVRLAFAVAAHLEPEILIVDEVLAVGDSHFQKKCLGKMKDVSTNEGRTVIFVSHNMGALENLCNKAILLVNGTLEFNGDVSKTVGAFLQKDNFNFLSKIIFEKNSGDEIAKLISANLSNKRNTLPFYTNDEIEITICYEVLKDGYKPLVNLHFISERGEYVFASIDNSFNFEKIHKGVYYTTLKIPPYFFSNINYIVDVHLTTMAPQITHYLAKEAFILPVVDSYDLDIRHGYNGIFPGVIRPLFKWTNNEL